MKKRLFSIAVVLVSLCAFTLVQAQSPYSSTSGSNTNYGSSGLNSFMRNSSQSDSLSKYLTNNTKSTSSNKTYSGIDSQNSTNYSRQLNTRNSSGLTTSRQGYIPGTVSAQDLLSDYNLKNNTPKQSSSDDIARSLADITEQLNSLKQQLSKSNNSNVSSSSGMQKYLGNTRSNEIASTSELYSGIEENIPGNYPRNNTNINPYNTGLGTSSLSVGRQYQPNSFTGPQPQQNSYESFDQLKAKLDELSRSIDSHLQTNQNKSSNYESQYPPVQTEQRYSDFQSYSKSQFDNYFNTAQQQLLRGNYYEAADSFTLASVYEPENSSCYAGQGHALFAAGQFVSSALYIIRAIELSPEYIQVNIDLMTITGDRNITELRTKELEQLLKKAPASGLQFLMAYVYYRTGKLVNAREVINAAYQETPNSRAVLALKTAIDTKINYSR